MSTTAKLATALFLCATTSASADAIPEALDRIAISAGIASVKQKVSECGQKSPDAKGKVKIKVTVEPSGTVSSAAIVESPEDTLGACVAGAVKTAKFGATKKGGTFSYPFVF